MWCGYFTELVSRPAKDQNGCVDYEKWHGDVDQPERPKEDNDSRRNQMFKKQMLEYWSVRRWNYLRRMVPHLIGWFPYLTAWAIIRNNFNEQIDDLCEGLRERMPDFVFWIIYGSFVIFSLFAFVQWR